MALHASIVAQVKSIARTLMRHGSAFLISEDGPPATVAATLGRIKDTTVTMAPVLSERDSAGRQSVMGYDITIQAVMMQSADDDLEAAFAMAAPTDAEDGSNGFNVLLSSEPILSAAALAQWNTGPIVGMGFVNAIIQVSPALNFSGGESAITLTMNGIVSNETIRDFITTKKIIFDV